MESERNAIETLAADIVDCAFTVHVTLGPGLLESVYEAALTYELRKRGLKVATQVDIPVQYDGHDLGIGFRADLIVEGSIIIEVKAVDRLQPVHPKQLLTYLRLTGCRIGFLMNFNERIIKNGIQRIVNEL
jgi:GxxExxY protein